MGLLGWFAQRKVAKREAEVWRPVDEIHQPGQTHVNWAHAVHMYSPSPIVPPAPIPGYFLLSTTHWWFIKGDDPMTTLSGRVGMLKDYTWHGDRTPDRLTLRFREKGQMPASFIFAVPGSSKVLRQMFYEDWEGVYENDVHELVTLFAAAKRRQGEQQPEGTS